MFTGIIQGRGKIRSIIEVDSGRIFWIEEKNLVAQLELGDSLAVNGTCLTVEEKKEKLVRLTAISQTLSLTLLKELKENDCVNLETAATLQTALGGHLVSGHVDGIARVIAVESPGTGAEVWLEIPEELEKYTIEKGSIGLDGISLTIAEKKENRIRLALIPETLDRTSAGNWQPGVGVHVEVDQMAKYVENFMKSWNK